MIKTARPVVLASASPRRRELLGRIVADFRVESADIDEESFVTPIPWETVKKLSTLKARVVAAKHPDATVIGCDTIVALPVRGGYKQLFKPDNEAHAREILGELSGREHLVITGVCIIDGRQEKTFEITTGVTFRKLLPVEIEAYVESGEPMDKAGAYAIQGKGAAFVTAVRGSLTNVIGLPVDELEKALAALA